LGLTAIVLLLFAAMALQERCVFLPSNLLECRANYNWFLDSPPNEIGDTLAGFAGSLAFIWIVITVWLQSSELSEQREVLIAQKEEFKAMVAAQNAQVEALRAQAAVFEDEKRHRSEKEVGDLFASLLNDLADFMSSHPKIRWVVKRKKEPNLFAKLREKEMGAEARPPASDKQEWYNGEILLFETLAKSSFETEMAIARHFQNLSSAHASLLSRAGTNKIVEFPDGKLRSYGLRDRLAALVELEHKMSLADRVKFRQLGISRAFSDFEGICGLPVFIESSTVVSSENSEHKE
jgi:hypothetical protein